ncbi:MAG: hypothetical protein GZ092_19745 [Polaromonas sp.]|nr:hypothetical protein [Polaromonas sp.]
MLLEFALLGALFIRLHQPVLIACIVVGPTGVVEVHDQIDLLSGQVAGDVRHGHALQAADPAAHRLAGYIH